MSTDGEHPATQHPDLFTRLCAPFNRPGEVKERTQAGRKFQYITARTAMNRLDEVLGAENWWDAYEPHEHSVICRLSILLPDGRTLTKCDAGGYAGMADQGDDEKSGYSDAFKRACVKFGVARYLYRDGVPEFADGDALTQNTLSQTPPVNGDAGQTPRSGKGLFAWIKEQQERSGLDYILKHVNDWGKKQGYPGRIVDWDQDQAGKGCAEAIRHITAVASEPGPVAESQVFEMLPNMPATGKALFGAIKDLEQQHGVSIIGELNGWAKKEKQAARMVEWPAEFIPEAWQFVSAKVARVTGAKPVSTLPASSVPHSNGTPAPAPVKPFIDELMGLCRQAACLVRELPRSGDPGDAAVRVELDNVAGMLSPGEAFTTFKGLSPDRIKELIAVARVRLAEVEDASGIPF